jgi:gas vesicle protein
MFGRKPRFNKFTWIAFGIGAVTGAAVALLYAPMTGVKLQKQLKEVIGEGVENVQTAFKKVV